MKLTDEQKYYSKKGKKYRSFDSFGNHWDIVVTNVSYHPEGYLWLEFNSMKNDNGAWMEDGNRLEGFILDVQEGRTIETN